MVIYQVCQSDWNILHKELKLKAPKLIFLLLFLYIAKYFSLTLGLA